MEEFKSNVLKIDLDDKRDKKIKSFIRKFIKLFTNLYEVKKIKIKDIEILESNKGFHIYIYLNKNIDWEHIVLYQSLLGSDNNRELSNFCRGLWEQWDIFNFFAIKKYIFRRGEVEYYSEEKYTKKCYWLEKKLERIFNQIKKGKYMRFLGKYH